MPRRTGNFIYRSDSAASHCPAWFPQWALSHAAAAVLLPPACAVSFLAVEKPAALLFVSSGVRRGQLASWPGDWSEDRECAAPRLFATIPDCRKTRLATTE